MPLAMPPASAPALDHDNDDDDDDLQSVGVADGFRAPDDVANHTRIPSITTSHVYDSPQRRRSPPPRPSSTSKQGRNSFTLRHDGATAPVAARNPTPVFASGALPVRSASGSTDAAFVGAEMPYQEPAGPSHPYQTYAQGASLGRSMSAATASTIQVPERSYEGPNGPTHPYGMYPQNTVVESDTSSAQSAPVLVGFPGLNNSYRRRLGPDGEEVADIIGPDGHTEQLHHIPSILTRPLRGKRGQRALRFRHPLLAPAALDWPRGTLSFRPRKTSMALRRGGRREAPCRLQPVIPTAQTNPANPTSPVRPQSPLPRRNLKSHK